MRSILYRTMRILESANLLFLVNVLLVAGLFVLGNYQEFMDASLILLVRLLSILSILCVASGLSYVATLIVWMIRRRHFMAFRLAYGFSATVVASLTAVIAGALETIVRPL